MKYDNVRELYDQFSILFIKQDKATDKEELNKIDEDIQELTPDMGKVAMDFHSRKSDEEILEMERLAEELIEVNCKLLESEVEKVKILDKITKLAE